MPIPDTAHNPAASASAQVPPAPAQPSGKVRWSGFSDQPRQFPSNYCNQGCHLFGGDASELYLAHRLPCVKRIDQAIAIAPTEKPNITPKSHCIYCQSTRHWLADCGDNQPDYLRPERQNPSVNRSQNICPHTYLLIRCMRTSRKKNCLTTMTCLGEPKVESPEALEVDDLPAVETLLDEIIR